MAVVDKTICAGLLPQALKEKAVSYAFEISPNKQREDRHQKFKTYILLKVGESEGPCTSKFSEAHKQYFSFQRGLHYE
jgi:hypothetical protein